jgi:dihydroorotase
MKPPLRTPEDVLAIKNGLAEDVIDVIATDHAPHSPLEKEVEFDKAAFGIIGLETAVPLTLALVREGVLELPQAFRKMSHDPARILGLPSVSLEEGGRADLAIIDPEREWILKDDDIHSKSRNSPFIGQALRGRNELTMVGGKVVWQATAKHPRR